MKKKKSPFEVDNALFVEELRKSNAQNKLTERAGIKIMRIADGLQSKYTYKSDELREDVKNTAISIACEVWKSFMVADVLITEPIEILSFDELDAALKLVNQKITEEARVVYNYSRFDELLKTKIDNLDIQAYVVADILTKLEYRSEDKFKNSYIFYIDNDAKNIHFLTTRYVLPSAFSWFTSTVHNGLKQGMNNYTKSQVADYSYSRIFEDGI